MKGEMVSFQQLLSPSLGFCRNLKTGKNIIISCFDEICVKQSKPWARMLHGLHYKGSLTKLAVTGSRKSESTSSAVLGGQNTNREKNTGLRKLTWIVARYIRGLQ